MDNIGSISISARSQLCILTEDGEIIEQRIRTTPERFRGGAGRAPQNANPAEASTESEWVARHLEGLGHEVIIGDPTFAPM